MKKRVLVFIFCVFIEFSLFSQEEGLHLISKGKYFSIYGYKELDILSLLKKLNFEYLIHPRAITFSSNDLKTLLADTLDSLYLEVSDILDLHLSDYEGKIYLLKDKDSVSSVFFNYFGQDFSQSSFYLYEKNSIYISCADITLGMLGHEIAHAIISYYFVVPPPAKIQEVLAGYVEYSLRKATGTLPR